MSNHTEKETNGDSHSHDHALHSGMSHEQMLSRIRTAGSISMPPDLFEKIYLSPENRVKGDLRKTFANTTPLAILGFLLSLSPLSADLMGWRGTGGAGVGAAGIGTYFFFGGLLMILGAVGEFILGNTFPFVVFGSFGAFWLSFAATLQPFYGAWGAYATDPTNAASGLENPAFYASFAFFLLAMALLCLIYLICSIRTNIAFFIIFLTLTIAFGCLSGSYWQVANGNTALAGTLQKTGGAFLFVTSASGWWIFLAQMLAAIDFPIQIPVGDLSTYIKGASQRQKLHSPA